MEPEITDLVIIGAGWHGLAAAKTALELNPSNTLLVLDSASTIGGVWAAERLYPGLRTNNRLGSYEYGDFPMQTAVPGLVRPHEHISGRAVHEYLKAYAARSGVVERVRLGCRVESVVYTDGDGDGDGGAKEWIIRCTTAIAEGAAQAQERVIRARKLILATGLTSQPRIPTFVGQESFGAPLFHVKDFARYQDTLLTKNEDKEEEEGIRDDRAPIAVLGGSKSAWDAVYACASQGHHVNWIIRASGTGPSWMSPAAVFSPLNLLLESLPLVRALGIFSPCIWTSSPIRWFLHGTWLGRIIVRLFWASLEWDMLRVNRYKDHPETAKLRPSVDPIWAGTSVGILNFPGDFFALIRRGLVKVHIADIERLEPQTIVLSNGDSLDARGLIMCTGWKASPGIQFLPEGIEHELGFPWTADSLDQSLIKEARKDIYTRLPMLRSAPASRIYSAKDAEGTHINEAVLHPFRLARFIVPPALWDSHSIAVLGTVTTFNTALVTEVQALWALIYLHHGDQLRSPQGKEGIRRQTALHTEFCTLRSPADHGARNADFVFEVLPYLDLLLGDLGLQTARKGAWWRDLFLPHLPRDYAGLVAEWRARGSGVQGGGKVKDV
ncbi:hypothetical protein BJY00DRAFT_325686 [Aspergillus carlsbadensis]|nr:hypothetical protein BJY00DRAFT_325686 [Aspergillus carlsbadensis]